MSTIADYKAYKKYEPAYTRWRYERDLADAKRQNFLINNPDKINQKDIQKGRAMIRAIDIMDEYSQKRAEDIEVAVESAIGFALDGALLAGAGLGALIGQLKPVQKYINKYFGNVKSAQLAKQLIPMGVGMVMAIFAAIPMYNWAAKIQVSASRRGRFEAMRKDLRNPNAFAVLNEEQIEEAKQKSKNIYIPEEKKSLFDMTSAFKTVGILVKENDTYKKQKRDFELEMHEAEKHLNDSMTESEIEHAKRDQQLLTKLVEKIDIASQDYAENAELATQSAVSIAMGCGALFNMGLAKILNLLKVKSPAKIALVGQSFGIIAPIALAIVGTQIQKQASRVGRYKVKQDLLKNPEKLVYVSNEDIEKIGDIQVKPENKENIFKFLLNAWKNNKEYNKHTKTVHKEEEKFYKAIENIKLTDEQQKEAKRLQRNAFRTFNKVDEKSQKYSESIEALGQTLSLPISLLFGTIGAFFATKHLVKGLNEKSKIKMLNGISNYFNIIILSTLPSILLNGLITKEQKKASRIADMLAINELSDYKLFK